MINYKLIKRYANSLYELSLELNQIEVIYKELNILFDLLMKSNDLKNFFLLPILSVKKKQDIIAKLFCNYSIILTKFIFLLIRHKREIYITDIIKEFKKLYNKFNNIVEVSLVTACHLNRSIINDIIYSSKLVKNTSNIIVNHIINCDIIGGYCISVEDKQLDCTIQSRLLKLRKKFSLFYNFR